MTTDDKPDRLLCRLRPNVGLYLQDEYFVLKIDDKKYYYDWIGSAIKAFIIWSLKRYQKMNCSDSVTGLIESIKNLDTTLAKTESELCSDWRQCLQDPVEQACKDEEPIDDS